jgi:hypothetical protein
MHSSATILTLTLLLICKMGIASTYDWEISGTIQCGLLNPETNETNYQNYPDATVGLWEMDRGLFFSGYERMSEI